MKYRKGSYLPLTTKRSTPPMYLGYASSKKKEHRMRCNRNLIVKEEAIHGKDHGNIWGNNYRIFSR